MSRLKVARVERLTADAIAVTFDVPDHLADNYRFVPGQHVTLRACIDGAEVRRSYSICAPPSAGRLQVAIKRLDGGLFSGFAHTTLVPGELIEVLPPVGRFEVRPDPARCQWYAAVVTGSGITPLMSIIPAVLETETRSVFTLVDGNATASSVMFVDQLAELKDRWPDRFAALQVLSREQRGADLLHGRIDPPRMHRLLDSLLPPEQVDQWLLCGQYAMVAGVREALRERGVPDERIHHELFSADGVPSRPPAVARRGSTAMITVKLGGRTSTVSMVAQGSVLDAVLAVRTDAPYACRGGVCGTCRARVIAGTVGMDANFALEPADVAAGFVLPCQSVPTSAELSLDFDC